MAAHSTLATTGIGQGRGGEKFSRRPALDQSPNSVCNGGKNGEGGYPENEAHQRLLMAGNSNSGRPGKPAHLHLLQGNPSKKNADQLLAEVLEPAVPVDAPPKPDWLSAEAAAEWDRVVADLLTLGWISKLDMMALATYCEAVADWQRFRRLIAEHNAKAECSGDIQTFATGAKQISVWRQLANDAEKRANAAGALFGFSPMARRNMKAAAPQGELFPNEQRDAAAKYFS